MSSLINVLNYSLPLLYGITVWAYAKAFFRNSISAKRLKKVFLLAALAAHLVYLLARTIEFSHPPITTVFEILTILAFTIAFSYRLIEHFSKVRNTGFFVLILSFFFQLTSTMFIQDLTEVNPVLRSNLLGFHVTSALLGYSAFGISAVYGFLHIMLYRQIKSNRFGVIYENLPNLEKLESMATVAVFCGFLLLTIAIVIGVFWLPRAFEDYSLLDPKLIGTFAIWLMYGVGLIAKRTAGWQGRKIMILSILGFTISILSLTVVNVYFSGFHNFF